MKDIFHQHPSLPTQLIPGYKILAMQAQYNMDIEYLAHNRVFNKHVVVKEFFPKALAYRNQASRIQIQDGSESQFLRFKSAFVKTARALSNIAKHTESQKHIAKTQGFIAFNNTCYMHAEHVPGYSLQQFFDSETVNGETLQDLFLPIIDELVEHHQHKLCHRNINTNNIIMSDSQATLVGMGSISDNINGSDNTNLVQGVKLDIQGLAAILYNSIIKQYVRQKQGGTIFNKSYVPLSSLSKLKSQGFSQNFLVAIDRALNLVDMTMPLSLREWRAYLAVSNKTNMYSLPSSQRTPLKANTNTLATQTSDQSIHRRTSLDNNMKAQTALNRFLGIGTEQAASGYGYPFSENTQNTAQSNIKNHSLSFVSTFKKHYSPLSAQTTETRDTDMPSNNIDILPMKSANDWLLGAGFTAIAAFVSMGVYLTMSSTLDNNAPKRHVEETVNTALIAYDHKPYHEANYENIDLTQVRNPHLEAAIARVKEGLKMAALSDFKTTTTSHIE